MASLSLPRVLQNRKTSLEIEREQFEKAQSIALHKAINKEESPVKQKHVRSAIIGTFSHQGAVIFWSIGIRLPVMDDMIVAWKFCHVLHKILREGHPLCIEHSQKHRKHLEDLGHLWKHLEGGYGKLIQQYTTVLIAKLDFHRRNPRFPGNLNLTTEDLTSICANNPDICFQLSVEMFDYLDTILELQQTIFLSKASSMTMQGQCRLAPIIPLLQDASRLYDHNVKILFQLHSCVPYDVLEGHRARFHNQFKQLRQFYHNTNMMHYFKNLITVSPLPEKPPNFQDNFSTYVTQEVYVPQEEDEPMEANLIDTSDATDHFDNNSHVSNSCSQINFDLIAERDNLIKSLREDCEKLKFEVGTLHEKNVTERNVLQEQILALETQVSIKESELIQEKQLNQSIMLMHEQDDEQKAKEEKFKTQYLKLREEHIALLREKAKVDKQVKFLEKTELELNSCREDFERKLKDSENKILEKQNELQSCEKYKTDVVILSKDNNIFKQEIDILKRNLEDEINEKQKVVNDLAQQREKNNELNNSLNELSINISSKTNELLELQSSKQREIDTIVKASLNENKATVKLAIEEIENPAISVVTCTPDYLRLIGEGCQDVLAQVNTLNPSDSNEVVTLSNRIAHKYATYIMQGKATSNTSPSITFGEKMAESCKTLGESIVMLLDCIRTNQGTKEAIAASQNCLNDVVSLADDLSKSVQGEENLETLLENEMQSMIKAIDDAAKQMEDLLAKAREDHSGIKLQVNERILDTCTRLMQAIRELIQKSRLLQAEIVAEGKGTASTKEFYKRNHQWTDGFISAAKAVGVSATYLLSAADNVVIGEGKLERLVVAAHEISASTTQLVVASRVKANRNSENLKQLSKASKEVTNATGAIVATVKDCSKLIETSEEIDTSNMSLHQAKRLEMDAQVRVLELEKNLEQERLKLSQLRRHHYQLAGEEEGWVNIE